MRSTSWKRSCRQQSTDAEDGSCLFGRVLYVNKSSMYKYDYVIDDHATEAFTACWDLSGLLAEQVSNQL